MAEIINLRTARKARARADKEAAASADRLQHGRTGQDKRSARDERARLDRMLDGAKREPE